MEMKEVFRRSMRSKIQGRQIQLQKTTEKKEDNINENLHSNDEVDFNK